MCDMRVQSKIKTYLHDRHLLVAAPVKVLLWSHGIMHKVFNQLA